MSLTGGTKRAVSDGSPMILWIDRTDGTYGLRSQDGYSSQDLPLQSSGSGQQGGSEAVNRKQPKLPAGGRFAL